MYLFFLMLFSSMLVLLGCGQSTSLKDPVDNVIVQKLSMPNNACPLPNMFFSLVKKVAAIDQDSFIGLLDFQETPVSNFRSTLFLCELGKEHKILLEGTDDSQIIDFALSEGGEIFALVSNDSKIEPDGSGFPSSFYRELEVFSVTNRKSLLVFHDPSFKDGLRYDDSGNSYPSLPRVLNRTLLPTQFSSMKIANIEVDKDSVYLTYVGSGGYRLAQIDIPTSKVVKTVELMPNTSENQDLFARFPPKISISDQNIYVSSPIYRSDLNVYNRHFSRTLINKITGDYRQLLIIKFDQQLNFKDHFLISDQHFLHESAIKVRGEIAYVSVSTTKESKIYVADYKSKQLSVIRLPLIPEASIWDIEFCKGSLWGAGIANYEQVATGSIVTYGDAYLWELNLKNARSEVTYYGTDRKDSFKSLSCAEGHLFYGGLASGPITHTGDTDRSLNYQYSASGRF